jgi:hypothetical protein
MLAGESATCERATAIFLAAHPPCYQRGGFCDLPVSDQANIIWEGKDIFWKLAIYTPSGTGAELGKLCKISFSEFIISPSVALGSCNVTSLQETINEHLRPYNWTSSLVQPEVSLQPDQTWSTKDKLMPNVLQMRSGKIQGQMSSKWVAVTGAIPPRFLFPFDPENANVVISRGIKLWLSFNSFCSVQFNGVIQ